MNGEKRKLPRNVVIVALVALASGFGQDLITPILPGFLTLLGVSAAGIGLIDGLLNGATSVFRFISGILSDYFKNRKWFVFLGYALSSIARPLLALANSFSAVAVLRTLDGVGKGSKDAPRDALIADSVGIEISGRAFGFHRLVDTLGSVFGPLTAAFILLSLTPSLESYRIIFGLAAVPGLITLLLIAFRVREPEKSENVVSQERGALPKMFWFFAFGMTFAMLFKINDSLFLLRAGEIGISNELIPALFAGFTFIYALASYPIGILSDRFGKLPFIVSGWLLLSIVELGFSFAPSLYFGLALFALYGLFFALSEGSGRAIIADIVPQNLRGRAYAIFHTLVGLSVIFGGYFLGRVLDNSSSQSAFLIASIGSFIGFLIFGFIYFSNNK